MNVPVLRQRRVLINWDLGGPWVASAWFIGDDAIPRDENGDPLGAHVETRRIVGHGRMQGMANIYRINTTKYYMASLMAVPIKKDGTYRKDRT